MKDYPSHTLIVTIQDSVFEEEVREVDEKEYKESVTIEISADTAGFEKCVDRCIAKLKELIQLCKQAGKFLDEDIRI